MDEIYRAIVWGARTPEFVRNYRPPVLLVAQVVNVLRV